MKSMLHFLYNLAADPSDAPISSERRHFLTGALSLSAITAASTLGALPAAAADGSNLRRDKEKPFAQKSLLIITAETGEVFRGELVPDSVREISDPKLGKRIIMEVQFDVFGQRGRSVREITDKIEKLALVHQELHRPPTVSIQAPNPNQPGLKAGLLGAVPGFSLFLGDGTPVRASVLIELVPLT